MFKNTLVTPLTLMSRMRDLFRSARSSSLIDYTQMTRVEPIVLLDPNFVHLPQANNVMQTALSIFSGYYLQALAISVDVGNVEVIRLLEKLNPSRSAAESAALGVSNIMLSTESYKNGLPDPTLAERIVSMESFDPFGDEEKANELKSTALGRDTRQAAQSIANLAVGHLLEAKIKSEGQELTVPISVRLITSAIANDTLVHILSYAEKDKGVIERWHGWRSGELEFIKDLMLCQDLISAHRKAIIEDDSGLYLQILNRSNKNFLATLLSGEPSVATASNIVVMTNATASQLESSVGGRLKDFKTRERIFENTYLMLMFVVDPAYERVTIYHRGIAVPTSLSLSDLKAVSRGNGPDVAEILKAYQLGQAPRF